MRVLRRRFDNGVQFASFLFVAVVLLAVSRTVPAALVAAALTVLAVRTLRAGLAVHDQGLTVRNTFGTHRIPWDDFHRVDIRRAGTPPLPAVVVQRRSGKPVALWCLQPPGRGNRGATRQVAVLKDVHAAIRSVRPAALEVADDA